MGWWYVVLSAEWARSNKNVLGISGMGVTDIRVRLINVLSLQVLQGRQRQQGEHVGRILVTTYRSCRWWALVPPIVTVRIVTVLRPVSVIGVVRTMVGTSIMCVWLIPIQLGNVVVIAC